MLTRRRVLAAKIEAAEGTAEAITVTDAGIIAINPKFDADIKMYDRANVMLNSLSKLQPMPGQKMGKISFQAELKGAGAAYSATVKPAVGMYLRACGFAETIVTTAGSETATYLPASTGVPSLTIWLYDDGVVKKLKGCRGTVKFDAKIGEAFLATFEFQGVYDAVADLAMISPTLEGTVPPLFLNASLTVGAYAAICETFSADMGNQLQMRPDVNSVNGYLSARITDRKPTCKIDPEMVTVATKDFYGLWAAGTTAALNIGPVAAASGLYNKFTITAPKLVPTSVSEGERSGNSTAPHDYTMAMNTGDDEFSILFAK
jgi:hypothetical protein